MPSSRLLVVSLLAVSSPALAMDIDAGEIISDIEVHGFVSQGLIKTTRNNYLTRSKPGSFDMTEVGINFTKTVTDRLRLGVQLFGGGFGVAGRYNVKADWFYLDYRWRDWLGVRAGRVKLPFGLYNEINDIDAARLPILLPQSTYPVSNRNFLLAQTGMEVYGYLGSRNLGALEYRLYGGTILIELPANTPGISGLEVPYVLGGRLMYETPLEGLRLGGSLQKLRLDADVTSPLGKARLEVPAWLGIGSAEYNQHDLLVAFEYSRWSSQTNSSNPKVFASGPKVASERYYLMLAYRLFPWFQLGAYYSKLSPNVDKDRRVDGVYHRENEQHDVAGTLRFDITPNWLVKLEFHQMKGTAALSAAINDRPIANLASNWQVFLLKTTAYF